MNKHEKDEISGAVCGFYDVDMLQMRGTGRTPEIVVARCALATELTTAHCTVSEIAQYMNKTDSAIRAMLEQYETRAAAAGLLLFVMPDPDCKPEQDAEETAQSAPATSKTVQARLVLDRLLRKAGGPRSPYSSDPMPPLYGLTGTEAQAIAIDAHTEHDIDAVTIADFFGVNVRLAAGWISLPDDAAEPPPIEVAQSPEQVDNAKADDLDEIRQALEDHIDEIERDLADRLVDTRGGVDALDDVGHARADPLIATLAELLPGASVTIEPSEGVEVRARDFPEIDVPSFLRRTPSSSEARKRRLEKLLYGSASDVAPQNGDITSLLARIDREDLRMVARHLAVNHTALPEYVGDCVRRALMVLVDALVDAVPSSEPLQ